MKSFLRPYLHSNWKNQAAFTLIELVIAMVILAVLSIALVARFENATLKAHFNDQVNNVLRLIEETRANSLSNYLILDTEPTDYYILNIENGQVIVEAHGPTLDEELERYTLESGFEISDNKEIFYYPPYGEICIGLPDCSTGESEFSFTLSDTSGTYSQNITISVFGGYPDLD